MNRHFKEVYYGLALNACNTIYHYCRYICDSWIYRQNSMDSCKVDYNHIDYPCINFPDHGKTHLLTLRSVKYSLPHTNVPPPLRSANRTRI